MNTKKVNEYTKIDEINGVVIRDATVPDFRILISTVRTQITSQKTKINIHKYLSQYDLYNNSSCQSVQSLSMIGYEYIGRFGFDSDTQFIFGYQGYEPGFITGVSPFDNWSIFDAKDHYLFQTDDINYGRESLLSNSCSPYNEITAYRRNEYTGEILKPSCIIVFDSVNKKSLEAAKKFEVDILVINREKIFDSLITHIQKDLDEAKSIPEMLSCLQRLTSIINGFNSHHNNKKIVKEIEKLIEKHNLYSETLQIYLMKKIQDIISLPSSNFLEAYRKYVSLIRIANQYYYIIMWKDESLRYGDISSEWMIDKNILNRSFMDDSSILENIKNELLTLFFNTFYVEIKKEDVEEILKSSNEIFDKEILSILNDFFVSCYHAKKKNKNVHFHVNKHKKESFQEIIMRELSSYRLRLETSINDLISKNGVENLLRKNNHLLKK